MIQAASDCESRCWQRSGERSNANSAVAVRRLPERAVAREQTALKIERARVAEFDGRRMDFRHASSLSELEGGRRQARVMADGEIARVHELAVKLQDSRRLPDA